MILNHAPVSIGKRNRVGATRETVHVSRERVFIARCVADVPFSEYLYIAEYYRGQFWIYFAAQDQPRISAIFSA
jgi:hypothetical protein